MKNYTAEELIAIAYGEKTPKKHTAKYNETREKLADMPQEKFDELYAIFNNDSTGLIGGKHGKSVLLTEDDVISINITLSNLSHEFTSISDIVADECNALAIYAKNNQEKFDSYFTYVSHWNKKKYLESDDYRNFVAKLLKNLAEMGEIEQYAVKTCGKVHIYLYRAK